MDGVMRWYFAATQWDFCWCDELLLGGISVLLLDFLVRHCSPLEHTVELFVVSIAGFSFSF